MGLLEHKQGHGTFVSSPYNRKGNPLAAVMGTDEATLDDLLEVRMGLECNAAMLAAQRATDTDLKSKLKSLEGMEDDLLAFDKIGTEADAAFHMAIIFSTKNPVLINLMRNFYDFLFVGIKKNLTHMFMDRDALADIQKHHRAVYNAIQAHKPAEANRAMHAHFQYVQGYFNRR